MYTSAPTAWPEESPLLWKKAYPKYLFLNSIDIPAALSLDGLSTDTSYHLDIQRFIESRSRTAGITSPIAPLLPIGPSAIERALNRWQHIGLSVFAVMRDAVPPPRIGSASPTWKLISASPPRIDPLIPLPGCISQETLSSHVRRSWLVTRYAELVQWQHLTPSTISNQ